MAMRKGCKSAGFLFFWQSADDQLAMSSESAGRCHHEIKLFVVDLAISVDIDLVNQALDLLPTN